MHYIKIGRIQVDLNRPVSIDEARLIMYKRKKHPLYPTRAIKNPSLNLSDPKHSSPEE